MKYSKFAWALLVMLILTTGLCYAPPPPPSSCTAAPSGMVGWWPAEGNATNVITSLTGTWTGTDAYAAGKVSQAFSLNGANYIDVGSGFDLSDMTIDAWVYVDPATNTGDKRVVGKDNTAGGTRKLFTLKSSAAANCGGANVPNIAILVGGALDVACAADPLSLGWHHLAGVRNTSASKLEIWVDGTLAGSKSGLTALGPIDSSIDTFIGTVNSTFGPGENFIGLIDELEIFNRALSPADIQAIYNANSSGKCNIAIDIKPGGFPNPINLGSNGVTPVAILTTPSFNAANVDPTTVMFAGAKPQHWALEDVDGDGDLDMILQFPTQKLNLTSSSTDAMLTGSTISGQPIRGMDYIKIVPAKK